MKTRGEFVFLFITIMIMAACGNGGNKSSEKGAFCKDTACMMEPLIFQSQSTDKPMVKISFMDCKIDTIHWEKGGMGVIKDIIFNEFIGKEVRVSKEFITCDIIESKSAWIKFNDCATGRGYLINLPFDKTGTTSKFTSAINNFDPKFKVEQGLVAYYDNTFIYVQDMATDLVAKILLTDTGVRDIDFDDVHSLIDSVNITKTNIYAKLLVNGKVIEHNKPLNFK